MRHDAETVLRRKKRNADIMILGEVDRPINLCFDPGDVGGKPSTKTQTQERGCTGKAPTLW